MGTSPTTAPEGVASITIHHVPYGPGALDALGSLVGRAKGGDPLRPVTVVVPTKVSGLALRRAMAGRSGGSVGVSFVVEAQLAELLAATALAARGLRPLTAPVRTEVVREALRRAPGSLGSLATHPATVRVVDRAFSALREATAVGGEAALLEALTSLGGLRSTLAGAFAEFRRLTVPTRYDEHDLAVLAAEAVTADAAVLRDVGTVIVHLPTRVTPAGARLFQSLAEVAPVSVVLGRTGDAAADAVTDRIGSHLAGPLAAHTADAHDDVGPAHDASRTRTPVHALVVPDAEEEVRQAARLVTAAMLEGADPARIAIVYRAEEPYATLVHEVLESAGIPHNGPTERTLAQTLAGRFLTDLWTWAADGHPRAELFDVLGSVPVRWRGEPIPAQRWDAIARQARVLGGRDHWDRRLEGFALSCERRITTEAPSDWLADRLKQEAQDARDLRDFALELADRLEPPSDADWSSWSTWGLALLDGYLGRHRRGWPDTDIEAEGTIRQYLTNLGQLDGLRTEMDLAPHAVTREDARNALTEALADPAGRVGRAGTGVYVGPIGTAGALDIDQVVVLGAVEGSYPPRARENVLLPDTALAHMQARAEEGSVLAAALEAVPTATERVLAARQAFHRVLASSAHVTLTVPRADRREQRARVPAPWLLDVLTDQVGRRVTVQDLLEHPERVDAVTDVPSRVAGLLQTTAPAGVAERRLQLLTQQVDAGHDVLSDPLVASTPRLAHGIGVQRARNGDALTVFDGHVPDAAEALRTTLERPHASSALAEYATCPRRYLFARVLRVRTTDEPRRWLDIDALDRGNLVHNTLELWVAETLPGAASPPAAAHPTGSSERLFEILDILVAELEATGRVGLPALWEREKIRIRGRLERWLKDDAALRERYGVEPVAVELGFGMGNAPLIVPTASGVTLHLRGRVDRVDADADGTRAVVTDYKTSRPSTYKALADDIVQAGTELQLPVYGLVAAERFPGAEVHVGYWHIHDEHRPPVLLPFGEAERARTQQVFDTLADAIVAGVFIAIPGAERMWPAPDFEHCRYCPFTTICPSHAERLRAAHRDIAAPAARRLLPLWDGGDA